jgi:small subunit ribosomal protein S2
MNGYFFSIEDNYGYFYKRNTIPHQHYLVSFLGGRTRMSRAWQVRIATERRGFSRAPQQGEIMTETTAELLVPNEEYLKSGIHIGTKFKTKYMKEFIYKTRPDGLSVLNIEAIDARIRVAISFLAKYDPKDVLIISRRENGWKGVKKMADLLGTKFFAGRYPPGVLTNPQLVGFVETKLILVTDPWPDRNAINDALNIGVPVVALCDTNNQANNIDLVVPCNNKGKKSLGLLFYLLTKGIMEERGLINKGQAPPFRMDDFTEE